MKEKTNIALQSWECSFLSCSGGMVVLISCTVLCDGRGNVTFLPYTMLTCNLQRHVSNVFQNPLSCTETWSSDIMGRTRQYAHLKFIDIIIITIWETVAAEVLQICYQKCYCNIESRWKKCGQHMVTTPVLIAKGFQCTSVTKRKAN